MDQSLQPLSENVLNMLRGALMMMFVMMCVALHPRRRQNPVQNHLFWLLIVLSGFLLVSFGFMFDGLKNSEAFRDFKILLDLCLVPVIGSFLLKIMLPECINSRKTLLILSPAIALMAIYFFTGNKLLLMLSIGYSALVSVVIFVFVVYVSVRHDRFMKNNFSNTDHRSVRWVRSVIYLFAAWYVAWSFVASCDSPWLKSAYYIFLIAVWTFIYRHSVRHIAAVGAEELFEKPEPETTPAEDTVCANNMLGAKLECYMEQVHPYLNPSLTLQEMATALKTNRTYLSEYFNKTLDTTFYDYINGFRIRYACELLLSEPDTQLLQIAEQSGFKALSTFRRAFEKHTGITPAKYRRQGAN